MNRMGVFSALLPLMIFSACGVSTKTVANGKTTTNAVKQTSNPVTVTPIGAQIIIKKSELIGTDFYYNVDAKQFAQTDELDHVGVFFREVGGQLHLVAGDHATTVIDATHPENLVSMFSIVSETSDTYVLSEANSSQYVSTAFTSTQNGTVQQYYAQAYQYLPGENLFEQTSTIILSNGFSIQIVETIFPRTLNVNPSATATPTATPTPTIIPAPTHS